jgi:hypothetical protein
MNILKKYEKNGQCSKFVQHILDMAHTYDNMGANHENITCGKKRANTKHTRKLLYIWTLITQYMTS